MESYPVIVNGNGYVFCPAVCVGADVGFQRDGVFLGVSLDIEGEGWGTRGPGISLDTYSKSEGRRVGTAYGCEFIMRVLAALGVSWFHDVKRIPVDVLYDDAGSMCGQVMRGFRCRKMHGGSGEWLIWSEIIDPATGKKVAHES